MAATGVLDGIRVVDFGRFIAGPFCAALLGDLGADVIRVERVGGAEDREIGPLGRDDATGKGDAGGQFLHANRNKRSLTLNPTKPAGREVAHRLIATADVIVANFPPQTLRSMGLDYESLCAIRPDIILATADAFGPGPYQQRLGFNGTAEVMSGSVWLSGPPGQPSRCYVPWVDYGTASFLALGVMAALMERSRSGVGQHVEGALLKTAMTYANATTIEQSVARVDRTSTGNRGQMYGPVDIVETSDGWVIVQILGGLQFERWAELMGEKERWIDDERFATDALRGQNGEVLSGRMNEWSRARTTAQALAELEAGGIPAGPVYSPQQLLDDPHVAEMGFLQPMHYPTLPAPAMLGTTPVSLSRTPGSVRSRPPTAGEHTDSILASLGYSAAEVAQLRAERII